MGAPKIPETPPAPPPPPPPTPMAKTARSAVKKTATSSSRKRGVSALTIRRPSVNMGSSGTGARVY